MIIRNLLMRDPDPTPAAGAAPVTPEPTLAPVTPPVEPVKPAGAPSPVSTTKPSILSSAGKPEPTVTTPDPKAGPEAGKEGAKKEGDPAAPVVPEKYEIKAPEGMTLSEEKIAEFTPIAKELGLTNDGLQKLVDYQAKQIAKAAETQQQDFDRFVEGNRKEAEDFFGSKLKDELPFIAKGRDALADNEFLELLERAGLASHKSVLTMFSKAGRALSEDKLVEGKPAAPVDTRSDGQVMYGTK